VNGPFLLIRATASFAMAGLGVFVRVLGKRRGKTAFLTLTALSALVAVVLELR